MSAATGTSSGTMGHEFLVFRAGSARCGVDIARVQEINRNMDVTRVFTAPAHVRGVINLRGRVVTVVDVARRMGVENPGAPASPKNVVVESQGELIGLLVDDIDDIVKAPAGGLLPPPRHLPEALGACAAGVLPDEEELIIILDVDAVTR